MSDNQNQTNTAMTSNKISTYTLTVLGVLGAISIVLVTLIHFPIMPSAPFLEYDPGDIPILIATFALGPVPALLLTIVVSLVQGLTVSAGSGILGIVMHIFSTGFCSFMAGTIYHRNKTLKNAILGLIVGIFFQVTAMVIMNLIFMPMYMGVDIEVVKGMIVPVIIPFNLIKISINCGFTFALYKTVSKIIKANYR